MFIQTYLPFWFAFSFLIGLSIGILCGWRLCRGLAEAQTVALECGPALRVTLDPGKNPWSGAKIKFITSDGQLKD